MFVNLTGLVLFTCNDLSVDSTQRLHFVRYFDTLSLALSLTEPV